MHFDEIIDDDIIIRDTYGLKWDPPMLNYGSEKNPHTFLLMQTRTLLTLWDSSLVEEALSFVEEHKVTPSTSVSDIGMSPFRRITQQLQFTNLKSPDADDPVTPDSPSAHAIHSFFKVSHGTSRADAHHNLKLEQDQFVIFPDAEEDEKKPIDVNSNNEVGRVFYYFEKHRNEKLFFIVFTSYFD